MTAPPAPIEPPAATDLDGLAALAARGFASTSEATEAVLRLVAAELGTRTSFLSRVDRDNERFEILAAFNAPGGCDLAPGAVLPLPQTY